MLLNDSLHYKITPSASCSHWLTASPNGHFIQFIEVVFLQWLLFLWFLWVLPYHISYKRNYLQFATSNVLSDIINALQWRHVVLTNPSWKLLSLQSFKHWIPFVATVSKSATSSSNIKCLVAFNVDLTSREIFPSRFNSIIAKQHNNVNDAALV